MTSLVAQPNNTPSEPPAPSGKSKNVNYEKPWVEKYRPNKLSEVVGNSETTSRLSAIAVDGNMPNLILSGPPGTGKTTSVHALARELLGEEGYKAGVLELNASDARGIDVVRNKIKMFAMAKVRGVGGGRAVEGGRCRFKQLRNPIVTRLCSLFFTTLFRATPFRFALSISPGLPTPQSPQGHYP